jgi:hypothetical protein
MKPNLVKRNIIIEILKKNNVLLQEHVSIKNTYFFNFILFSIILFGLLLLIFRYLDKKDNSYNVMKNNKNNKNNKILIKNTKKLKELKNNKDIKKNKDIKNN